MPDRCAPLSFDNIHLEVLSFLVRLRVLHKREKEKLFYFMYHPAEALELVFSIRGPHYPNLGPLKCVARLSEFDHTKIDFLEGFVRCYHAASIP